MKKIIIVIMLFGIVFGKNITISGYLHDQSSGEALIGANIIIPTLKTGTATNAYGFYSISLSFEDSLEIVYSYIGYQTAHKIIVVNEDQNIDIDLASSVLKMDEIVTIGSRTNDNVEKAQMGLLEIPISTLRKLPAILGEADVLKIIQTLPGVQSGAEGTTGFYVRGGNTDQNLVLLDEAVVYNPSHLFGLLSTFNSSAINNISLVKGGFPAQYGGRLSSSMKISMKEGNNKDYHIRGGIGMIASNLTFEGPIIRNKASFIISARRTFFDLLLKPLQLFPGSSYSFYDINAKVNFKVTNRDRIYFSVFKGLDDAAYVAANSLNYKFKSGNSTQTFRWNHLFGDKLFSNTSLIKNSYMLNLQTIQGSSFGEFFSRINDGTAKIDFEYFLSSQHNIKFGLSYTDHIFTPTGTSGKVPKDSNLVFINSKVIQKKFAHEGTLYLNDEVNISRRIGFNIGLRLPSYRIGQTVYNRMEPRATAKFTIAPKSSIKMSYTVMNQFVHLVPSATASIPTDIWILSSPVVKPQQSKQIALGYFQNSIDDNYEFSFESYYKTMTNQVAFKEGTHLIEQTNIDSQLVFGKGWSYGAELFLKKKYGQYSGWISYSLSWTNQKFSELNFGKTFPFKYDRRHDLSIVGIYKLNHKWSFSSDFVFSSGNHMTLPEGRVGVYQAGGLYNGIFDVYTSRNNYQLRPYNRLDITAIYKHNLKMFGKSHQSELVLSIYNVYSRMNPYFVYLDVDATTQKPIAKQVSLLPIIPSISYNINF
ncbi:MAG: TonB-dependent receptor plug domain-containing protein [Planctomycetia bacterium]|nr:TonB-dependent receptor plug domain-containing protein [Planctomycetia bacterium]